MKKKMIKIVCALSLCIFVAGAVSARPHHHHGGGRDLHRAAAIVDIVTNSLIGLNVLSGNAPVYVVPPAPVPVYVPPPPPPPPPVIVIPPRRHYRPAPPPRRHYKPAPPPRRHAPPRRGGRR